METTNKTNTKSPAWIDVLHDRLSLTDIKILEILNENGRISDAELAKKLGVSMSTVRLRRKQLESKGILKIVGVIVLKNLNIPYADLILHINSKKLDKYYNDYLPFLLNNDYVYETTQYLNNFVLIRVFHKDYQNLLVTINEILLRGREIVKEYRVYVAGNTYKAWGKNII
ncbi:MAG: AsnC family protein [Vulcanisaeta sp.]